MDSFPVTLALAVSIGFTSFSTFRRQELYQKLVFWPYVIQEEGSWYRFLSSGFIHANWPHLLVNLWVLWMFGRFVEGAYAQLFGSAGPMIYLSMFLSCIVVSELYSFFKHKDNPSYRSLGASGAVSGVLFTFVLLEPLQGIGLLFIPFYIPAFLFGILYLLYSWYMARKGNDNIGHDAHFFGALYGMLFLIILKPGVVSNFIQQIQSYLQ